MPTVVINVIRNTTELRRIINPVKEIFMNANGFLENDLKNWDCMGQPPNLKCWRQRPLYWSQSRCGAALRYLNFPDVMRHCEFEEATVDEYAPLQFDADKWLVHKQYRTAAKRYYGNNCTRVSQTCKPNMKSTTIPEFANLTSPRIELIPPPNCSIITRNNDGNYEHLIFPFSTSTTDNAVTSKVTGMYFNPRSTADEEEQEPSLKQIIRNEFEIITFSQRKQNDSIMDWLHQEIRTQAWIIKTKTELNEIEKAHQRVNTKKRKNGNSGNSRQLSNKNNNTK